MSAKKVMNVIEPYVLPVQLFLDHFPRSVVRQNSVGYGYAHFMMGQMLLPAVDRMLHHEVLRDFELFVDLDGAPHRVITSSRFGTITLEGEITVEKAGVEREIMLIDITRLRNWRREADPVIGSEAAMILRLFAEANPSVSEAQWIKELVWEYTKFSELSPILKAAYLLIKTDLIDTSMVHSNEELVHEAGVLYDKARITEEFLNNARELLSAETTTA